MDPVKSLLHAHNVQYPPGGEVRAFSCPGRINLIGEHIDYNGGHVLPAAIDKAVYLCISPNRDSMLRFSDLQFNERKEISLDEFFGNDRHVEKIWLYPYGASRLILEDRGPGFDLSYYSAIPTGAGVSSSAAITTVTLFALASLTGKKIKDADLALMGQRVEKEFAGVSCGIMDQFAVIHGRKNSAMLLDTRDLSFKYVDVDSDQVHFILVNSGKKHSLRDSAYNDRRRECESALAVLKKARPQLQHLCDLALPEFSPLSGDLGKEEFKRAFHAVSENERTLQFCECLKKGDYKNAGKLLYKSHESLRDNFEVSIPEMDRMVEWARGMEGVYGARMMGGGFGGCTINMVQRSVVGSFIGRISREFETSFGNSPEIYDCTIEDGVREIPVG